MMEYPDLTTRLVPQSIEAEACVLGGLLLDKGSLLRVKKIISGDDFHRPAHQTIYQAVEEICNAGKAIDLVILRDHLESTGRMESVGGIEYLVALAEGVPSAGNDVYYAEIVREKSARRAAIRAAQNAINAAYEGEDFEQSLKEHLHDTWRIASRLDGDNRDGDILLADAGQQVVEYAEDRFKNPGQLAGYPTGIKAVDSFMHGLRKGHLVVVAATPKAGKSALATQMAMSLAEAGRRVLFVSGEMNGMEVASRILCRLSAVPWKWILEGSLRAEHLEALGKARRNFDGLKMELVPRSLSLSEIELKAWELAMKWGGLDAIFIDYLQIMRMTQKSIRESVIELTSGLKRLTQTMDLPIVLLSQFERSGVKLGQPPTIFSLKESGSIENDANDILLMHDPGTPAQFVPGVLPGNPRARYEDRWLRIVTRDCGATDWPEDGRDGITLRFYKQLTEFVG